MPPEVGTKHKFGFSSDVWSFGFLIWELFSLQSKDKQSFTTDDANALPMPPKMNEIYTLIVKQCWQVDPNQRPSFSTIYKILNKPKSS